MAYTRHLHFAARCFALAARADLNAQIQFAGYMYYNVSNPFLASQFYVGHLRALRRKSRLHMEGNVQVHSILRACVARTRAS